MRGTARAKAQWLENNLLNLVENGLDKQCREGVNDS